MMAYSKSEAMFVAFLIIMACTHINEVYAKKAEVRLVAQICRKDLFHQIYDLIDSTECKLHKLFSIDSCMAQVYKTLSTHENIPVTVCRTKITKWETFFYFFGSKIKDIYTIPGQAVGPAQCQTWSKTRYSQEYGKFVDVTSRMHMTQNKPEITYKWCSSKSGNVKNIAMIDSFMTYNHATKKLHSPLADLSLCNPHSGFCAIRDLMFIWSSPKIIDCPKHELSQETKIQFHKNSTGVVYRIELPEFGISTSTFQDCAREINLCFNDPTKIHCVGSHFIVKTDNCTILKRLHFAPNAYIRLKFPPGGRNRHPLVGRLNHFFGTIEDVAYNITEQLATMTDRINHFQCQVEKQFTTILRMLSNQYPSEVLTAILGHKVIAVTKNDVIYQLHCEPINVTIQDSLIQNKTISARHVVRFENDKGESVIGQIYSNGAVYKGIRFLQTKRSQGTKIFRIYDKYYKFENNTFVGLTEEVEKIHPSYKMWKIPPQPADYLAKLAKLLMDDDETDDFLDMQNLILTLSDSYRLADDIKNQAELFTDQTEKSNYDPHQPWSALTKTVRRSFFAILSSITNPFLNFLVTFLMIQAFCWGMIWSIGALKRNIPKFRASANHLYRNQIITRVNRYRNRRNQNDNGANVSDEASPRPDISQSIENVEEIETQPLKTEIITEPIQQSQNIPTVSKRSSNLSRESLPNVKYRSQIKQARPIVKIRMPDGKN